MFGRKDPTIVGIGIIALAACGREPSEHAGRGIDAPPGWTCGAALYGDDVCDCGCGVDDSDCNGTVMRADCERSHCPAGALPWGGQLGRCATLVAGWNCETDGFADGQCLCGCGAQDADCTVGDRDECVTNGCPAVPDTVNVTFVQGVPAADDPTTCVASACGDGWRHDDESCDDGDATDDGGCSADCQSVTEGYDCASNGTGGCHPTVCGDGLLDDLEGCDDSNTQAGDGCSDACDIEAGWFCPEPGAACRPESCGNGTREGVESCDDGNTADGDGCDSACELEACPTPGEPCVRPPAAWRCMTSEYGDDQCDCGCGAHDRFGCPALAEMTIDSCDVDQCTWNRILDPDNLLECYESYGCRWVWECRLACDPANADCPSDCDSWIVEDEDEALLGTLVACSGEHCADQSGDALEACVVEHCAEARTACR